MRIAVLNYFCYASFEQRNLTTAKDHCNKGNRDRKDELFHNCNFCLIFFVLRPATDPFTRIFHKWISPKASSINNSVL